MSTIAGQTTEEALTFKVEKLNEVIKELKQKLKSKETLRDKFAMSALTGILSRHAPTQYDSGEWFSEQSYIIAYAMMKAREK